MNSGRKRLFSTPFDGVCAGARAEVVTVDGDVVAVDFVVDAGAGVGGDVDARTADASDVERASARLASGATRVGVAEACPRGAAADAMRPVPAVSAGCDCVAIVGAAVS